MIRRVALLVTILLLSLTVSASAAEPGQGIVEGQLVNGTEGGRSVADIEVTLKTYLNNDEVGSTSDKTDAEGRFVFDSLATESGYSYQITAFFEEADYSSDWLDFNDGETTKFIEVTVYDSTTSDETIKIATAHTVIYIGPDSLQVEEYYLFANEADRTYIGSKEISTDGKKETLRFSLPKEAFETEYLLGLMGCCIIDNQDGFVDTMPVLPGAREIAYSYEIDHSSGKYTFSWNVEYPTLRYDLLIQGEGIAVNSSQLSAKEPAEINGIQYQHFSGQDLVAGEILVAQLSGLPETNNQGTVTWVVIGVTVLVGGFFFTRLMRKKRVQTVSAEDSLDQRRKRLLIELAQMDDDFAAGKIAEEVYRRLRATRKAQLVELMSGSKEERGNR